MGQGVPGAFPALAGDTFVVGPGEAVAGVVLNGRGGMPSFGGDLSNDTVAAVNQLRARGVGQQGPPR